MRYPRFNTCMQSNNGFALLEILIALSIVAIAGVALLARMQSIANTAVFIEERTVAHWVAEDIMQEKLIEHSLQGNITRVRKDQDTREFDGRDWFWRTTLQEVPLPPALGPAKLFRLEIEVGLEEDKPMAAIAGFVSD